MALAIYYSAPIYPTLIGGHNGTLSPLDISFGFIIEMILYLKMT
jgi:hypothetical protein